ncbi:MAG: tryptophan--tRNA ligase [Ilumatobacter sp.]|nr:tryptophan--tRNA ligase [Ilumatobacter sp.]
MSTCSLRISCNSRSKGPSYTGVATSTIVCRGYRLHAIHPGSSEPDPESETDTARSDHRGIASTGVSDTIINRESRVLSCMQPTGDVHLGNYLGALKNWVQGQHKYDAFHGIVDLHALTVAESPGVVGDATVSLAAMLFAVGLDPDAATVFAQSHVSEHSELGWIMQCNVAFGELSRMTQFKDKTIKREGQFTSAGLFTYPALQAADILLYDTDQVPVGEDQRQHIEITRDIAIRFNRRFGETFVLPEAVTPTAGARVMSLQQPTSKMSKSDDSDAGCVYLIDEPGVVMKKFKRAVTDSDSGLDAVRYDRNTKPGIANLLEIHAAVTDRTPQAIADEFDQYGALKTATGEAVLATLDPIRLRYQELMDDRGELARLLRVGAEKARAVASVTLGRAHSNIGIVPR